MPLKEILEELDKLSYEIIAGKKQWVDAENLIRQTYLSALKEAKEAIPKKIIADGEWKIGNKKRLFQIVAYNQALYETHQALDKKIKEAKL